MRPELKSALDLARELSPEELPALVGSLEEIKVTALARLTTRETKSQTDELPDVNETARRLHCSKDYLYRNSTKYSFTRREGRKLLFSSSGLALYLKQKSR
jgi:hypothetical protein